MIIKFLLDYWTFIFPLACLLAQIFVICKWWYSRNKKLRDNLKKPLFLYEFENNILQRTEEILKNSDFITRNRTTDLCSLDDLTKEHSILIIGYSSIDASTEKMQSLINRVINQRTPLIVFCNPKCRIKETDMEILSRYSYYEICNTPLRLIMLIDNICQNFNYK